MLHQICFIFLVHFRQHLVIPYFTWISISWQVLTQTLDDSLRGNLTQLENSLKHAHEKDNLIHFMSEEEVSLVQIVFKLCGEKIFHIWITEGIISFMLLTPELCNSLILQQGERKRAHSKGLFKLKLKREGRRGGVEREVREWGPDEVAAWLDALQLTEYRESFIRHDIRGSELLNLERR